MAKRLGACLVMMMSVAAVAEGGQDLLVLSGTIDGVRPHDMMNRYLLGQIEQAWQRWQADYENRKTPEQIAVYQKRLRDSFLKAIGPFPERTPLNARVTGVVNRKGYRVEKVIFESMPGFYVTAALFLPDVELRKPPYPGVLVPCGHSRNGKAHDTYQTMGAALALNGMVALVFDPIDQGERMQLIDKAGKEIMWGTRGHTMAGIGSMLVGATPRGTRYGTACGR